MLPGVQKSVREWTLTLPRELPLWEFESQWTPESSEGDRRGQNSLDWGVPYIIENILERRCLKWAHMTHLDIWNTKYVQKKGWESNWQFDSRPLKVGNRPDFLASRWRATYRWKSLDKKYNVSLNLRSIGSLKRKLWTLKVVGVPSLGISGLPLGSPGTKCHLDVALVERHIVYYKGEGGGFPQVRAVVSLVSLSCPWFVLTPKMFQLYTNHLVSVLCRSMWVVEACQFFLVPSQSSSTPLYPSKVLRVRERASTPCSFVVFCLGLTFESLKELGVHQFAW
jgi:hypothetical protein